MPFSEYAKEHQIPIIPQVINFGEESFLEGVDMDINAFMSRLKSSSKLPKTAAPPPELFIKEFEKFSQDKNPILCIHPSTEVSGTVRSAIIASQDFPDANIHVVDTRLVASPLGTIVKFATAWAEEEMGIVDLIEKIKEMSSRCRIYFLVDSLDYLARGGRIGGASALLGGMLQVKPILRLNDGKVDQYEKERTHKRAIARLKEIVLEQIPRDGSGNLTILHADAADQAQKLASELSQAVNQTEVEIYNMPPAIVNSWRSRYSWCWFFHK